MLCYVSVQHPKRAKSIETNGFLKVDEVKATFQERAKSTYTKTRYDIRTYIHSVEGCFIDCLNHWPMTSKRCAVLSMMGPVMIATGWAGVMHILNG